METSKKQPEKLQEFYIGERTTLTIENVSVPTLMTRTDYNKFSQEQNEKGIYSQTFFAPNDAVIEHGIKLKLFCTAFENGNHVLYYKSV